ncbi:MAG: hypothetical protein WBP81_10250 [Solirubrobacteraceae bacterium]
MHRHLAPLSRLALRTTLIAVLAAFAAGARSPAARADGDPASDVLAQQSLFLPQDAGVPARQQARLTALLQATAHAGYPIRVALIASPTDLGSVTALWRQPQRYATFLGQELALIYHGPLLVVMPNALGLYQLNRPEAVQESALAHLPTQRPGTGLGQAALTAVQSLAAASGHPVPVPSTGSPAKASATDTTSWIVFAAGGVLIVLAWVASFRAKPPQLRRRRAAST